MLAQLDGAHKCSPSPGVHLTSAFCPSSCSPSSGCHSWRSYPSSLCVRTWRLACWNAIFLPCSRQSSEHLYKHKGDCTRPPCAAYQHNMQAAQTFSSLLFFRIGHASPFEKVEVAHDAVDIHVEASVTCQRKGAIHKQSAKARLQHDAIITTTRAPRAALMLHSLRHTSS